jgi:hypothetical protein
MKKLSIFIFVITLLLLLTEISLRFFFGLGEPPLYYTNSKYEYALQPNQNLERFGNNFFINKMGYRSKDFNVENENIIYVIGDSVVNGGMRLDQSEIVTEQLLNSYKNECGNFWQIANISAGSWGPANQRFFLEDEFQNSKKLAGVYIFSTHDLNDLPKYGNLNPILYPQHNPYFALQEVYEKYFPKFLKIIHSPKSNQSKYVYNDVKGVNEFKNLIIYLDKIFNELVIIHHLTMNEQKYGVDINALNIISNNLEIVNQEYTSDADLYGENENIKNYYFDDIHLNALGSKTLSELIKKQLMKLKQTCKRQE